MRNVTQHIPDSLVPGNLRRLTDVESKLLEHQFSAVLLKNAWTAEHPYKG
jgi:hypothetical protein